MVRPDGPTVSHRWFLPDRAGRIDAPDRGPRPVPARVRLRDARRPPTREADSRLVSASPSPKGPGPAFHGNDGIDGPDWAGIREMRAGLSASRARHGFSPSAAAAFISSFKEPLFTWLR